MKLSLKQLDQFIMSEAPYSAPQTPPSTQENEPDIEAAEKESEKTHRRRRSQEVEVEKEEEDTSPPAMVGEEELREMIHRFLKEDTGGNMGRNWHTPNQDPIQIEDLLDFDVLTYMDTTDGKWHVVIQQEIKGEMKEICHETFGDGEEAKHWAWQKSEEEKRKQFSKER